MKIARETLLHHLERVRCDGMIPEAVFSGAFASAAISPDNTLIVDSGPMEDVEDLGDAVGFDLSLLTAALKVDKTDLVEVALGGNNRLLAVVGKVSMALVVRDPVNTTTKVPDQLLEALRGDPVLESDGYPLDPESVRTFLNLQKLLKPDEVRVVVGPESGLRVGRGTEDQGQVALPGVSVPEGEGFDVLVGAEALKSVFELVGPDARMWFGEHAVTVRDGTHTYNMSRLSEEE